MSFLEGYILGLGMIVFIGPVFFLLLSISLQLGTGAGVLTAFGIVVSDLICVSLCYYGVTAFLQDAKQVHWIAITGGILLVILGLKYLFHRADYTEEKKELEGYHYLSCFVKGFLVNFVNPFVFFVWIGVVTYQKGLEVNGYNPSFYLSGVLFGILSTDLLKVLTARQIKSFLSAKVLQNLYRGSGIILIGFGIRMLLLFTRLA
ncbi:MAG: LysE family transporter [Leptospiraceae bacterium]|jgi:threonine/homoserine/homoserine lactone efflux protein|nr:LysE family transporter [Leptospiraceae bacterium]